MNISDVRNKLWKIIKHFPQISNISNTESEITVGLKEKMDSFFEEFEGVKVNTHARKIALSLKDTK
jgi:hypothetical protein